MPVYCPSVQFRTGMFYHSCSNGFEVELPGLIFLGFTWGTWPSSPVGLQRGHLNRLRNGVQKGILDHTLGLFADIPIHVIAIAVIWNQTCSSSCARTASSFSWGPSKMVPEILNGYMIIILSYFFASCFQNGKQATQFKEKFWLNQATECCVRQWKKSRSKTFSWYLGFARSTTPKTLLKSVFCLIAGAFCELFKVLWDLIPGGGPLLWLLWCEICGKPPTAWDTCYSAIKVWTISKHSLFRNKSFWLACDARRDRPFKSTITSSKSSAPSQEVWQGGYFWIFDSGKHRNRSRLFFSRANMFSLTPGRDFLRAWERWSDCSKIWEADCFTVPWNQIKSNLAKI